MGYRHMTWEHCRIRDSAKCANKSLLSIPTGDGNSVFHTRQLLWHMFQGHTVYFTVTISQLIVSPLPCLLSVCKMLSWHWETAIYIFQSYFQSINAFSNHFSHGSLLPHSQRKSQNLLLCMSNWASDFFSLPSTSWSKKQISATFNLTHAVADSTRPFTDGKTSVQCNVEMLDHGQEVGLFDFNWQR